MINRPKEFKEITDKMIATYTAKNHDYGGSYTTTRMKYPLSILIRLNDKFSRLETLMSGKTAMVKDESIDDTLLDLATYCIMELVERRADKEYVNIVERSDAGESPARTHGI